MSRISHTAEARPKRVSVVVEDVDGTVTTYSAEAPESAVVEIERDALPAEPDGDWARFWPSPLAHFDVRVVARSVGREIKPPTRPESVAPLNGYSTGGNVPEPDTRPAASAHEPHCKGWHSALGPCAAPAYAHEPGCNTVHDGPAACPPPTEAVLSETSEPYVSVSVSGNDAEQVLKLVREGLREHRSDYVLRG